MSFNQISVYHTLCTDLKVPAEKPKLKCLGLTYSGAKLFNMLTLQMRETKNPNAFKTMSKDWIWKNIPSY